MAGVPFKCPKCSGFVVIANEYDMYDPTGEITFNQFKCLMCGMRMDATMAKNKQDPAPQPTRKRNRSYHYRGRVTS